jgi:hypothetical protein
MTDYLAISPDADWIRIDDAVLAFVDDTIHLLSGSAAEVWAAVDGTGGSSDVVAALAARHRGADDLASDVTVFVDDLVQRRLLVRRDEPTGAWARVPSHVAWTTDQGLVALADLRTGGRRTLSATASRIWDLTVGGASREALLERLAVEFTDLPATFPHDVDQLLRTLVEEGLLELGPGAD